MLCKSIRSKKVWTSLVIVGMISLIFGIVCEVYVPEDSHSLNMLMGMFTGLGASFVAIGILKLIHCKRASAAKLKQEEINLKDERNVEILRLANSIANTTASILFAVMAFVFVGLGYRTPAFICLGALYVQIFAFFIAYRHYNKTM